MDGHTIFYIVVAPSSITFKKVTATGFNMLIFFLTEHLFSVISLIRWAKWKWRVKKRKKCYLSYSKMWKLLVLIN